MPSSVGGCLLLCSLFFSLSKNENKDWLTDMKGLLVAYSFICGLHAMVTIWWAPLGTWAGEHRVTHWTQLHGRTTGTQRKHKHI